MRVYNVGPHLKGLLEKAKIEHRDVTTTLFVSALTFQEHSHCKWCPAMVPRQRRILFLLRAQNEAPLARLGPMK